MPAMSAAMVVGGLSLIGVPGTAGFISKWLLVSASIERGWWFAVAFVVLSTLLTVANVWRVFEVLYIKAPPEGGPTPGRRDTSLSVVVPAWVLAVACVWFGIDTDLTLGSAQTAAESLLSGSLGMVH